MAQTFIMAVYLSTEKKAEIFSEYGGTAKNTGSTEGQIALFTYRILELSQHLKEHPKDHACRKALLTMVGRRKQMLTYLAKKDLEGYRALIEKLGIRNIRK
jgi:small subunit ribosomal protein S15